jgi:hypothetical protein
MVIQIVPAGEGTSSQLSPGSQANVLIENQGGKKKKTIYFNYRSRYNWIWDSLSLTQRFAYGVVFPEDDQPGLTVDLTID